MVQETKAKFWIYSHCHPRSWLPKRTRRIRREHNKPRYGVLRCIQPKSPRCASKGQGHYPGLFPCCEGDEWWPCIEGEKRSQGDLWEEEKGRTWRIRRGYPDILDTIRADDIPLSMKPQEDRWCRRSWQVEQADNLGISGTWCSVMSTARLYPRKTWFLRIRILVLLLLYFSIAPLLASFFYCFHTF